MIDIDWLRSWIGKLDSSEDEVSIAPITALSATLGRKQNKITKGAALPHLWHWLFFLSKDPPATLSQDGSSVGSKLYPPIPLTTSMWVGGRVQFHQPIFIGKSISRLSEVVDVSQKEGRSGPLIFLLIRHHISEGDNVLVTEEQDIAYQKINYRDTIKKKPAPVEQVWIEKIIPNEVLLFRYAALTFNSQRVHYDRGYAKDNFGYADLPVQASLVAILLVNLLETHYPKQRIVAFSFRALMPLFIKEPFYICGQPEPNGRTIHLWAKNSAGFLAVDAVVTIG